MKMERLAYLLFGNNIIIGPHIRKQLSFLKEIVPTTFLRRQMDDLGCGDGKVTVLLKDIFLPSLSQSIGKEKYKFHPKNLLLEE